MIAGIERASVLTEAAEDLRRACEYITKNARESEWPGADVVAEDLGAVATRLEKLAVLETASAKQPPKYKRGDVVISNAGGPDMVVLNLHESTDGIMPVMYECFFQDHGQALSVQLPEFAVQSREEYMAPISWSKPEMAK